MTRRSSLLLAAAGLALLAGPVRAEAPTPKAVAETYASMAEAMFQDSLSTAEALRTAIAALVANPTDETLAAARTAWLAARVPYLQTEVYRFGNPAVDDWEGKVNSWPLDEGLIDYVDAGYGTESDANGLYTLNVIANPKLRIEGVEVDATEITPALLAETLQGAAGVEANVATGYHAIEFLLWGQDLNGTGPGAGDRPATDFDAKACTNGNCERRAAYLTAAADLLVSDLQEMVEAWGPQGEARARVLENEGQTGLAAALTGMGSLSYGELAGERTKLGLMLHDPEEEQDCFSDNTFNSHYYDVVGIRSVYLGSYTRVDGSKVEGPSLSDLVEAKAPDVDAELTARLDATLQAATALKTRGETVEAYDQMIGEGNAEGNAVVQALVDSLVAQVPSIERAVSALGLSDIAFEGSDSLDNPTAVFQ
ncbi:imelysin family protein [Chthonobacter rhizosphaerae]|uniref:imelysin family protein n=1 Tax=Chthonobacter rhizosphaerae TaxID=2735553 RepID=UPI0015EF5EEB|nr:imelysin family protein [Chthonobacter rhizosphaerae]